MTAIIKKIYDYRRHDSLAIKLRRKRFALFKSLLDSLPTPIKILDVGGRIDLWQNTDLWDVVDKDIEITIINLDFEIDNSVYSNIKQVSGDARNMQQFRDKEFDVVFSNSVIEHVGSFQDQLQMSREVMRVGKRYFIQTPNLYFPIEPHFIFPFFQFLPVGLRVFLLNHFDLGWIQKIPDKEKAKEMVTGIRLLSKMELAKLFPKSNMYEEKFLGLTKSFTAYDGWDI
ncbi:MAG: class I SAM-dependent methyltransferase [Iphinoe sp. HA4291-MV1]|jgi:SAM-dependent methyltransferase|nr:class I SAM-dependent methyltransferase [Iphinoe sp. HA4291-MV1]